MFRGSSFNVFLEPGRAFPVRIFNTAAKRSFRFQVPWEDILGAANSDPEFGDRLLGAGLVTRAKDYSRELDEYFARRAAEEREAVTVCYTVTTECALGCDYCFQNHLKRQATTSDTIARFMFLLQRHLDRASEVSRLDLLLFGGDPILRPELCCQLLHEAKRLCRAYSLQFGSLMTTNGIDADESTLRALREAGLTAVQVSFDGHRMQHNRLRGNTYDRILANLALLRSHFHVALKYNVTRLNSSVGEYVAFLDCVDRALPGADYRVILEAIQPTTSANASREYFEVNSADLARCLVELSAATRERNVCHNLGAAFHPPCFLTTENSIMVTPEGDLSPCDTAYGIPAFTLGNVAQLEELPLARSLIHAQIRKAASKVCVERACSCFPLCETGCFYEKHRLGIGFDDVVCRRAYVETFIPHLYRLHSNW